MKQQIIRKILIVSFFILIVSVPTVYWFGKRATPPKLDAEKIPALSLPILLDNPQIGSVFIHYFLNGEIENLVYRGNDILIQLKSVGAQIPEIAVTDATRVWKTSPPYTETSSVRLNKKDLKAGQMVDVSAEYDLKTEEWIIRDIFIPTDKN